MEGLSRNAKVPSREAGLFVVRFIEHDPGEAALRRFTQFHEFGGSPPAIVAGEEWF